MRYLNTFFRFTNRLMALLLLLSSLLILLPLPQFYLDLFRSFAFHWMIGCGLIALIALLSASRLWLGAGLLSFLTLFFYLSPHLLPYPATATGGDSDFRIGQFNVNAYIDRHAELVCQSSALDADVLAFQEVSSHWLESLDSQLCQEYPYSYAHPSNHTSYGLAIYSRQPLCDIREITRDNVNSLSTKVGLPGQEVQVIVTHTRSPTSRERYRDRNAHLRFWAHTLRQQQDTPTIFLGDTNAVPWDPGMKGLREKSGLRDARTHLADTFPSWAPVTGIPIDHILYSKELERSHFERLSRTGSDHHGLVADFVWREG